MHNKILVMGVSGCGKSIIGDKLAANFNFSFHDGDDFHPPKNVQKMRDGQPLNDDDRSIWLRALNKLIHENDDIVVACSALTLNYREQLRKGNEDLTIIYLKGSFDTIWPRLEKRRNHYFSGSDMLKSQFETLQEPSAIEAIVINIDQSIKGIVTDSVNALKGY